MRAWAAARSRWEGRNITPGPAYDPADLSVIKPSSGNYVFGSSQRPEIQSASPGPGAYGIPVNPAISPRIPALPMQHAPRFPKVGNCAPGPGAYDQEVGFTEPRALSVRLQSMIASHYHSVQTTRPRPQTAAPRPRRAPRASSAAKSNQSNKQTSSFGGPQLVFLTPDPAAQTKEYVVAGYRSSSRPDARSAPSSPRRTSREASPAAAASLVDAPAYVVRATAASRWAKAPTFSLASRDSTSWLLPADVACTPGPAADDFLSPAERQALRISTSRARMPKAYQNLGAALSASAIGHPSFGHPSFGKGGRRPRHFVRPAVAAHPQGSTLDTRGAVITHRQPSSFTVAERSITVGPKYDPPPSSFISWRPQSVPCGPRAAFPKASRNLDPPSKTEIQRNSSPGPADYATRVSRRGSLELSTSPPPSSRRRRHSADGGVPFTTFGAAQQITFHAYDTLPDGEPRIFVSPPSCSRSSSPARPAARHCAAAAAAAKEQPSYRRRPQTATTRVSHSNVRPKSAHGRRMSPSARGRSSSPRSKWQPQVSFPSYRAGTILSARRSVTLNKSKRKRGGSHWR